VDGIILNDLERGEIGPGLFKAACQMGLEGLVSKRQDRPYRAGRSPHWVKVKNPTSPATKRVRMLSDDVLDLRPTDAAIPD
jgi:bifunctional non-homologous end joining protein LigD